MDQNLGQHGASKSKASFQCDPKPDFISFHVHVDDSNSLWVLYHFHIGYTNCFKETNKSELSQEHKLIFLVISCLLISTIVARIFHVHFHVQVQVNLHLGKTMQSQA